MLPVPENPRLRLRQVQADEYEANLREIVTRIKALPYAPRLIWCRTTPVYDPYSRPVRVNAAVIMYNRIADRVMIELGIEMVDLYLPVWRNLKTLTADGTHFTQTGSRMLGETLAEYLIQHP